MTTAQPVEMGGSLEQARLTAGAHRHDLSQLDGAFGCEASADQLARRIQASQCAIACEGDQVVGYVVPDTAFYERGFVWLLVDRAARLRRRRSRCPRRASCCR